ncbi:SNF2 family N-terminal domain-containing protein [Lophiotrema nucula]|uniref:SNF2 family N-terminal domain-containing protein n=1 Tax=Lophiotrema nucula TaxID=690887 RepID=A0A6A5YN70_9PLEO|nr:SNF2 family N-terminal domain-containing protein [Lophiotrema nucula]
MVQGNLIQPNLDGCNTLEQCDQEITFFSWLTSDLDKTSSSYWADKAHYANSIERVLQRRDQVINGFAVEDGFGSSASSYLGSGVSSPADQLQSISRKRSYASMGDFDLSDSKRPSMNPSPHAPGTPVPMNLSNEASAYPQQSHGAFGGADNLVGSGYSCQTAPRPQYGSSTMPSQSFQPSSVPATTTGSWPTSNQHSTAYTAQSGVQGSSSIPFRVKLEQADQPSTSSSSTTWQQGDYIDLTGDDGYHHNGFQFSNTAQPSLGAFDPFPELATAYVTGQPIERPTPADAFNQELMRPEELAEFLITPSQPGGGYALQPTNHTIGVPNAATGYGLAPEAAGALLQVADLDNISGRPVPYIPAPRRPWDLETESLGDMSDDVPAQVSSDVITRLVAGIKPEEDVPPEQREKTPSKMKSQLMEHQKLALRWLKDMEASDKKGSLLADEMGLGKTVQALALILARPSNDHIKKTTLIIAPVALMRQWEKEIERHVKPEHLLSVYTYHGTGKKADFNHLRQYDIVLATFGAIQTEMKQIDMRKEAELQQREQQIPSFKRKATQQLSLLPDSREQREWYRIIIDEAQCIKNKNTLTSRGVSELRAQYRLCMTGTPMQNSIDELYPILRFLRLKPYNDWHQFSYHISKPLKQARDATRQRAMNRVHVLLKSIMLRRGKDTQIDGGPICKIPPKHEHLDNVEFSDDEHAFYKALESKTQLTFNKYLAKGTVMENYANVLVLLLRLRQACCHPHLIKDLAKQVATDGIAEVDLLSRAKQLSEDVVNRLKNEEGFECPICYDATNNATIFVPCGHHCCGDCFAKLVDPTRAIQEGNAEGNSAKCPHCRGTLSKDKITDFKHFCKVFCREKLRELGFADDVDSESDDDDDEEVDSEDDSSDDDLADFIVPDDFEDDDDNESGHASSSSSKKGQKPKGKRRAKGKGKARGKPKETLAQLKKDSMRSAKAKRKYFRRLEKEWETSAKIEKTLELLEQIATNDTEEKTLVFSQFTSLLDLLEVPLHRKGVVYERYDGSMKMEERADAVERFMDDEKVNLMLLSMKAGNAGLNLSKASKVIILDPFWNPYVESQAVDRAHRMPQEREVHVHRLLVPETVEDRICALQEKKRELIEAALDESAGKNVARLGLGDLMFLFGVGRQNNQ